MNDFQGPISQSRSQLQPFLKSSNLSSFRLTAIGIGVNDFSK